MFPENEAEIRPMFSINYVILYWESVKDRFTIFSSFPSKESKLDLTT